MRGEPRPARARVHVAPSADDGPVSRALRVGALADAVERATLTLYDGLSADNGAGALRASDAADLRDESEPFPELLRFAFRLVVARVAAAQGLDRRPDGHPGADSVRRCDETRPLAVACDADEHNFAPQPVRAAGPPHLRPRDEVPPHESAQLGALSGLAQGPGHAPDPARPRDEAPRCAERIADARALCDGLSHASRGSDTRTLCNGLPHASRVSDARALCDGLSHASRVSDAALATTLDRLDEALEAPPTSTPPPPPAAAPALQSQESPRASLVALLEPEDLGRAYERLLARRALLAFEAPGGASEPNLRRAGGSYYTPENLIEALLARALEPLLAELTHADGCAALLGLTVLDPACGAGHVLLAAARRLAVALAQVRGDDEPRRALREVLTRCIYGVDLDATAVELCQATLWLAAADPDLPLATFDARIRRGHALLGATPERLAAGVPDAAWDPDLGDDRATARLLKRRNREPLAPQRTPAALAPAQPSRAPAPLASERAFATLASPRPIAAPAPLASHAPRAELAGAASAEAPIESLGPRVTPSPSPPDPAGAEREQLVADAWCAAFFWPRQPGALAEAAPVAPLLRALREGHAELSPLAEEEVRALASRHAFLHWHLAFPHVFAEGGFALVLGNPPWLAHAGRAAQPLAPGLRRFYKTACEGFAGYPTTHGLFAALAPRLLRPGGVLGLVLPASVSELDGYEATRAAHDRLMDFDAELADFGEGRFDGVTQPTMALVSRRSAAGRRDAQPGAPWPMERPDLTPLTRALLARLDALPRVPAELFAERGFQSDAASAAEVITSDVPVGRFTTPLREGSDVREFELGLPRLYADATALGKRLRSPAAFRAVAVLVRQTARFPIAAVSDGLPFRNSLLAALSPSDDWPPDAVAALLNSALIRWAHFARFRDARQPVLPQVKVAHLRALPLPRGGLRPRLDELTSLGARLARASPMNRAALRAVLDALVGDLYELSPEEREAVTRWHEEQTRPKAGTPGTPAKRRCESD